jgi:hypothetical protein
VLLPPAEVRFSMVGNKLERSTCREVHTAATAFGRAASSLQRRSMLDVANGLIILVEVKTRLAFFF